MRPSSICNRSNNQHAMSLMEVVITMALLSVIFAVVADLLHGGFRTMRDLQAKGQAGQATQMAMSRICCEIREAQVIETAQTNQLVVDLLDPNYASSANTNPWSAANLYRVTYTTDGKGMLTRSIAPKSGGSATTEIVADGIQAFNCTWANPGSIQVVLMLQDTQLGNLQISSEVYPMVQP